VNMFDGIACERCRTASMWMSDPYVGMQHNLHSIVVCYVTYLGLAC
jgi:hypothetical protein